LATERSNSCLKDENLNINIFTTKRKQRREKRTKRQGLNKVKKSIHTKLAIVRVEDIFSLSKYSKE
jgi:hypothetical protein